MIELHDVHVHFGDTSAPVKAVNGVSLRVERGQSYGLVGESGSGKSTVLRAIAGLCPLTAGSISINESELLSRRSRSERRNLQMVFQDPFGSLHPRHTVNDILKEPIQIHGIKRAGKRIDAMLARVGLDAHFRFRYPHQLSGGQRQRVAIARALILEPDVLLLDEPTSALDVSIQAEVLNLLSELREEAGLTYLMVSHNLAVVAHLCDRISVMNQGRVVEEITDKQLFEGSVREGYTRQLWVASKGYDAEAIARFQNWID